MSITDIEQLTLDFIRTFYKKEYIGKLEVEALEPEGYSVTLYPQGEYEPMQFCAYLDDEAFVKQLREFIRQRKFHLCTYGRMEKVQPYLCQPINKSCSCNDEG